VSANSITLKGGEFEFGFDNHFKDEQVIYTARNFLCNSLESDQIGSPYFVRDFYSLDNLHGDLETPQKLNFEYKGKKSFCKFRASSVEFSLLYSKEGDPTHDYFQYDVNLHHKKNASSKLKFECTERSTMQCRRIGGGNGFSVSGDYEVDLSKNIEIEIYYK
jgi:hypothetical protein